MRITYSHTPEVTRVLHLENPADTFGNFAIETIERHDAVIESVKALRDDHKARGDIKHVARVPLTIVEQAMREGWYNDKAKWRRWLNDPDNNVFRVWQGQL